MQSIIGEGRELFKKLISLPDEVKNAPAPPDLQDQFVRWRSKLLNARRLRARAVADTLPIYVSRLTVRLLSYNLELLLEAATTEP